MTGILPYLVARSVLLISTSKDESIGDVSPVADAHDLADSLDGRTCLVVGGTRGIGRGIALNLAKAGASVVVVGRDTSNIATELKSAAPMPSRPSQILTAHSADLFTVSGARTLVDALANDETLKSTTFDYVFLTVGCWPNYSDPFNADGIEKTVALDLVARHAVLTSLIRQSLLKKGGRVMSTLASTQQFPFQSAEGVRKCLEESTDLVPPGRVPFYLMPIGLAGDAWLREASRRYQELDLHFVGMFPGLVATDVANTSFPGWMAPILRWKLWLVGNTEEEAGLTHVTVMTSENVGRHRVSFYNHLLEARQAHEIALDDDLAKYVFDRLEKVCANHGGDEK